MTKQASGSSSMKGWRGRFWLVAAGLCVLACGGKLDEEDGATSGENVGAPNATASPKPGTAGGTALPPCELGFLLNQEPARDCNWLARERCYETKLAACACACPVNRQDSICSSGFDNGPNGRTEVKCY